MRWITQKGNTFFLPKRCALDDLTARSVVWAPYTRHRTTRSFDSVSLYSGFIGLSDIVHLRLSDHTVYGVLSTYPTQTSDDYMVWYRVVSHPIMVSPKTMDDAVANLGVFLSS
ncbi:uncharacterized protein LOC130731889 [Lotus japonicus]|uniref:uncharacterized protein LOC130731889 n=1 Tax=Lotus japonicus TaxID=34305 RepID=UPI00258EACFB|nr:uncharacterized protein LOC130731889 [Lotus japonicus]